VLFFSGLSLFLSLLPSETTNKQQNTHSSVQHQTTTNNININIQHQQHSINISFNINIDIGDLIFAKREKKKKNKHTLIEHPERKASEESVNQVQ